jgi:ABC-2 type transport system ATP-binding protein
MKMELIAALLHRPQVVYLDEPTLGLDLTAQQAIRNFLLEYRHREKPAMILTSHYMEDIRRLCPRVVVVRKGRFVYDGPLKDLPSSFDRTKILTVQLNPEPSARPPWPEALGKATIQGDIMTAHVPRKAATQAAAHALDQYSVEDISLAEEDIGEVVEALIREGGVEAP